MVAVPDDIRPGSTSDMSVKPFITVCHFSHPKINPKERPAAATAAGAIATN